jgi:hypothetical protein
MTLKLKFISIVLCVISITFFISCKKKKTEEPEPKTNVFTFPAQPYSILQTAYRYSDNNHVIYLDSTALGFFKDGEITSSTANYVSAGNVAVNDSNLYNSFGIYSNTTAINISGSIKWTATGSPTISAFTYSYIASYPKYSGGNLLADTFYKSAGITLNINGVTNTTNGVTVLIDQSSISINKYLSNPNGVINIPASDLSSFSSNQNISIELIFSNTNQQTLGGKLIQFNNDITYSKLAYLKP